ncbi:MAG: hypothetical protein COT90_02140 [Candidatus Diapherotrites archaeon CG10_big_fil_rev_8_21_14_0_10_31_34]|nr:MAG: hypothetical protein COT90_02140 [Candidatus Diapherotrites archaeon CG10_big_fil_rev_8_21_14_0_10_31_34]
MNTQNSKIDSKGRIVIPNSFRESLGIKKGEKIIAELDKENERIILFPLERKVKKMHIFLSDNPGSLAKAAEVLRKNKVDLVFTESRSTKRGKEALWSVVADFSKVNLAKVKKDLEKEKLILKATFAKV